MPAEPIICNPGPVYSCVVSFHNFVGPARWSRNQIKRLSDTGNRYTQNAGVGLGNWWHLEVPGQVRFSDNTLVLNAARVNSGSLTFSDVDAIFNCLITYKDRWQYVRATSADFDLNRPGSQAVIARGGFRGVWAAAA